MLYSIVFTTPTDLTDWVNKSDKIINIHGICNNEFMEIVLFYSIENEIKIETQFDITDEINEKFRNRSKDRNLVIKNG